MNCDNSFYMYQTCFQHFPNVFTALFLSDVHVILKKIHIPWAEFSPVVVLAIIFVVNLQQYTIYQGHPLLQNTHADK